MALTTADLEEYLIRKMMDQSGSVFTAIGVTWFMSRFTISSDSAVESYLQSERNSESGAHAAQVQSYLTSIRNEVST